MRSLWNDAIDRFATRGFWLGAIVWISYVAPIMPSELPASEAITVWLVSGRDFTGELDATSNEQKLVLRSGTNGVSIRRAIDWERVVKATQAEKPLAIDDLKTLAAEAVAAPPVAPMPVAKPKQPRSEYRGVFAEPVADDKADQASPAAEPIRMLAADVFVANWDRDVEVDGLVVQLYPLDRDRQITAVSGTLEVELYAPEVRRFIDAPRSLGITLEKIGHWTQAVYPSDITDRNYAFELPFQAVHPQFNERTLPYGLVHVKLSVPGEGVFETTQDYVRIRPWSPIRDDLWRSTGRRFLPTEQTGRGVGTATIPPP